MQEPTGVKVSVNTQQLASWVRQGVALVAGYAALTNHFIAGAGTGHVVTRGITGLFGAGILWVEHYVSDPSTGTDSSASVQ